MTDTAVTKTETVPNEQRKKPNFKKPFRFDKKPKEHNNTRSEFHIFKRGFNYSASDRKFLENHTDWLLKGEFKFLTQNLRKMFSSIIESNKTKNYKKRSPFITNIQIIHSPDKGYQLFESVKVQDALEYSIEPITAEEKETLNNTIKHFGDVLDISVLIDFIKSNVIEQFDGYEILLNKSNVSANQVVQEIINLMESNKKYLVPLSFEQIHNDKEWTIHLVLITDMQNPDYTFTYKIKLY